VAPVRVGEALLPAGDYEVCHTMAAEEHEKQIGGKAEAKVKCTLVPTQKKAEIDQTI
jgi:hypothetical protein